jgi:DNA-binding transcriptional LysR family regulator
MVQQVVQSGLVISAAAHALDVAQPAISKQIRLLEDELGIVIFKRNRSRLIALTAAGKRVLNLADRILLHARELKDVSKQIGEEDAGTLIVGTTHSLGLRVFPALVKKFMKSHENVNISIRQGSPNRVWSMLADKGVDLALASASQGPVPGIEKMYYRELEKILLVPRAHPLAGRRMPSLKEIAGYPLITYDDEFSSVPQVRSAFEAHGFNPKFVLTATDTDVIKAFVAEGLGVAIVSEFGFDSARDSELRSISVRHLFKPSRIYLGHRGKDDLPGFAREFIRMMMQ